MSESFDDFIDLLDYPMFVVTALAEGNAAGCLVGFATQSSIDPPTFLVGISTVNHTYSVAREAVHLAVHVVGRDHLELAQLFGAETGDSVDKFEHCQWHTGPEGLPILDAARAWFVGRVLRRFEMGDHIGHLLAPIAAGTHPTVPSADLVSLSDFKDLEPGHDS